MQSSIHALLEQVATTDIDFDKKCFERFFQISEEGKTLMAHMDPRSPREDDGGDLPVTARSEARRRGRLSELGSQKSRDRLFSCRVRVCIRCSCVRSSTRC